MGLYHPVHKETLRSHPNEPHFSGFKRVDWPLRCFLFGWILIVSACSAPQATQALIQVSVHAEGKVFPLTIPAGSTVQQAVHTAGLTMNELDRVEPPAFTVLTEGASVKLVRVSEKLEVKQVPLPYARQTLRNESLALDQEVLLQRGKNGLQEITYRRVFEDGIETSEGPAPIKVTTVEEPLAEIVMIGVQAPFSPTAIPGRLIFLRDGNAWMMETSTANRRAILTTGDLDGRVLSLSTDRSWLLFTRKSEVEGEINRLWVLDLETEGAQPLDLQAPNVVHFADFVPGSTTKIVFSTVEPRDTAPGWQANNDLYAITFSLSGWTTQWAQILEQNTGGVYGWWGMDFSWAPDGKRLAYTRPDGIGLLGYERDSIITNTLQIIPYQTGGDWAWVPGLTWGPDSRVLFTVNHVPPLEAASPEASQAFDLAGVSLVGGIPVNLVKDTGMFAYPIASPLQTTGTEEIGYQIAYLQATFPQQSETSSYQVVVMDRDGSNRNVLFPQEGAAGIKPQDGWGAWSPEPLSASGNYALAVIYQGNLWLADIGGETPVQVTGDGLTSRVIWK